MPKLESNIWKMYVFSFITNLHFILGILIPFFMLWGKISFTQIMMLEAFYMICSAALEAPTGAIADRFGRKVSLGLSAFVIADAVIVFTLYPSFYLFIIAQFLWALGGALQSGADEAMIYDTLKNLKREKESKKIFGRNASFALAAAAIAAPVGSVVSGYIGLDNAVRLAAIPMFIAFLFSFTLKEPEIVHKKKPKDYFQTLRSGMQYFRKHKVLQVLAFNMIFVDTLVFPILWTYQLLLQEFLVPIMYFGFVLAALMVAQIIVTNNHDKFESLLGSKKRYLLATALLSGVCFILLALVTNVYLAVVLILLMGGFCLWSRVVLLRNYMNKHIESHNRATVISSISMVSTISMAVMYPLMGLLVDWSLRYSFMIIGVLILLFTLISKVEEEHLID